jgi:hypothetical protein
MTFYDYIEIGTSDFDTEIEKNDERVGISVEPIKYYLERLPNKQNCIKLNLGISNYTGTCVVNYLSEQTIKENNFPSWVRGCNSVNSYHKTVSDLCVSKGIDIEKISERDHVNVTTLHALMNDWSVEGVYFLKIDTEGHDTVILEKFYEEIQTGMHLPHVIQFESNVLSSAESVNHIIRIFQTIGYDLMCKDNDTVLKLNLNRIRNKTKYTGAIKNYYIMDYPLNYSVSNLPHENTLEGAKEYCTKHGCSGITLQDGIYQVRNGKYMNYHKGDIHSWVFMNESMNAKDTTVKIGIAMVCTNSYFVLGLRFVKRFVRHYTGNAKLKFHLFTDTDPTPYLPNIDVVYFNTQHACWQDGAESKFENIMRLKDADCEYLYFFDADTNIVNDFNETWFIGDLVGGEHFANDNRMKYVKDYDRNPNSKSYIPHDTPFPQVYYLGAFFGGRKDTIIEICKTLIHAQKQNQLICHEPVWNDESYLNHYFHYNPPQFTVRFKNFEFVTSDKGGISIAHDTKSNVDINEIKKTLLENSDKVFDLKNGTIVFG